MEHGGHVGNDADHLVVETIESFEIDERVHRSLGETRCDAVVVESNRAETRSARGRNRAGKRGEAIAKEIEDTQVGHAEQISGDRTGELVVLDIDLVQSRQRSRKGTTDSTRQSIVLQEDILDSRAERREVGKSSVQSNETEIQ